VPQAHAERLSASKRGVPVESMLITVGLTTIAFAPL
jgi:hypothetical protein